MRISRAAHIPWAMFVLVATALAALFYAAKFHPQDLPTGLRLFGEKAPEQAAVGGTPLGLILGSCALAIFVFAALLGMRKRLPGFPIGHVQTWLRGHIWLTLLTVPLVLLHCGFHRGSPMTTTLLWLYGVVMLSGIYGLILQQRLPTVMKDNLPAEIVYEQIPNIRAQLCAAAKKLQRSYAQQTVGAIREETVLINAPGEERDLESEAALADFIGEQLLPYLEAKRGERFRLSNRHRAEEIFRHLKLRVAGNYRPRLAEMERWCDERRRLDLQTGLQHWLHGWLLLHAPLSFLLLLFTVWHAFVTLFRY